jgi:hypothetical protein
MKLHMSLRKRIALCAALGLGAVYVSSIAMISLTNTHSASAMAVVKCTQLKGLANKSDYTCMFFTQVHLYKLTYLDGTADLVLWTK